MKVKRNFEIMSRARKRYAENWRSFFLLNSRKSLNESSHKHPLSSICMSICNFAVFPSTSGNYDLVFYVMKDKRLSCGSTYCSPYRILPQPTSHIISFVNFRSILRLLPRCQRRQGCLWRMRKISFDLSWWYAHE